RVIVRRIGEHRATTPLAYRLSLAALVEQLANAVVIDAGLALEVQAGADEPFVLRPLHVPIADFILGRIARVSRATTVQYFHIDDVLPGLAANAPCVHGQ